MTLKIFLSAFSLELCAFGDGKGSCKGDSGGPLFVSENNRKTLIGVVNRGADLSTNVKCENQFHPTIFARVGGPYRDWVRTHTRGAAVHDSNCDQI